MDTNAPAAITTTALHKRYPSQKAKPALDSIEINIPQGALYGLVGADGAGKTTLLRILSTVLLPTSGSAQILGHDTRKGTNAIRSLLGYMPQEFSQYPDLSLAENLDFFANIQHVPENEKQERIKKMLDFTMLAPFADRRAGKLSGGMKKKLALACAMVHNPRVLILDEPSTGVDPVSRRELWTLLAQVVEQGVTVLVSTPYMDEAERCHQVAMLYEGELLTSGTPEQITKSLPFNVLEVKAKPRKKMREVIDRTQGIVDWSPVGDRLRVAIKPENWEPVVTNIKQQFEAENLQTSILRPVRNGMEDAFVHLVRQERDKA